MSLTIDLTPETLEALQAEAEAKGRTPEELAAEAVAALYAVAPAHRFDPELIAALREGIADIEAGRETDFADYVAERRAARSAEAAQPEAA